MEKEKEVLETAEEKDVVSKNFIEQEIDKDLAEGVYDHVQTRFPPEPNGYLHIGHAKSILLNYGLAQKYGGKFNLRFDDTNPTKEKTEFVESIMADVKWLGADFEDRLFFASNYFQQMYECAVLLIKKGKAFVCDLTADQIREYRGDFTTPGKESPYRSFFKFYNEDAWPDNGTYDGWWGHDTLPKLNYEDSPKLFEYIMKIAGKWVSAPYGVDGWRLDVAADLGHSSEYNHKFWQEFRKHVKEANPEAIILAEHYGDPSSWLAGDQWDTVMNYDAFMEPLTWFLTGMEKHSDEYNGALYGDGVSFFRSMYYHMSRMQTQSVLVAMNQLSNHDHSRFLTRTNQIVGRIGTAGAKMAEFGINYGIFREAIMVQMTWPGAPTLYYGDEAGVCGWTDPDNRRTYPWGFEDFELIEYHRYLIDLHKKLPALRRGSLKQLLADRQLIAYGRMSGANKCAVIINNRGESRSVRVPVWELGITDEDAITRMMLSDEKGYNAGRIDYRADHGWLTLDVPAHSGVLLSSGVLV